MPESLYEQEKVRKIVKFRFLAQCNVILYISSIIFSRISGRISGPKFGLNTRTFFPRSYAKELEALRGLERWQYQLKIWTKEKKNEP